MGLLDRITSGVVFVGTAIPEWVASILPKATKKASSDFSPNMFPVPTPTPKPPPPGKKTGSALESADKSCNVCAVQPSAYARNPLATPPWQAKPHSAPFMSCQALAKPPP
jgi:hypothetical protein